MDSCWLNAARQLKYVAPRPFLLKLRELEPKIARSDLSPDARALRTHELKEWGETRAAAICCYGMAQRTGQTIRIAKSKSQDRDFVASWIVEDTQHFAPLQLKEAVPVGLNPLASVQATIDALAAKYVDSEDLTVIIYLNQQVYFDPTQLRIPKLRLAGLWVFGALSESQSEWGLWGDVLTDKPVGTRFTYPA
jgi:hypothetical protein